MKTLAAKPDNLSVSSRILHGRRREQDTISYPPTSIQVLCHRYVHTQLTQTHTQMYQVDFVPHLFYEFACDVLSPSIVLAKVRAVSDKELL